MKSKPICAMARSSMVVMSVKVLQVRWGPASQRSLGATSSR